MMNFMIPKLPLLMKNLLLLRLKKAVLEGIRHSVLMVAHQAHLHQKVMTKLPRIQNLPKYKKEIKNHKNLVNPRQVLKGCPRVLQAFYLEARQQRPLAEEQIPTNRNLPLPE